MQNGYIESFNGKFRDECLNEHWFETLPQARAVIACLAAGLQRGQAAQQLRADATGQVRRALHRQHAGDAKQPATNEFL
jgi:putative transposase